MQMLSVVIITYNEEKNIGRCINSVQSIANEIVVLDSFSTDNTVRIAVAAGAVVYNQFFAGYIEQKNKALSLASHDFILSLDADEAIDSRLQLSIAAVKKQSGSRGYTMNRCTNYCGRFIRNGLWYPDIKLRLFDRRFVRWGGDNPHDKAEFISQPSIRHLKGDILHYSYNTLEEHVVQNNNFSTISADALYKKGKRAGWIKMLLSPSWAFINSYFLRLGFLDGYYGFVIAGNIAHLTFLKYTKLYQKQKYSTYKAEASPDGAVYTKLLQSVRDGNVKAIARSISLIENEADNYEEILRLLPEAKTLITGITGPPGAGKSTLVDALIRELVKDKQSVAVLCVDPSSPFNLGALLGDRIRMSDWYNHPKVYIRSLASRGSLGGLHSKIIEITELLKASPYDHIIIETVGVGQSEIEIAGLADTTVVVVVPESGDEIQTMKAGLMEIADIFVVNKADRPDADLYVRNLQRMLTPQYSFHDRPVPVLKTIASRHTGIDELIKSIQAHQRSIPVSDKKNALMAERAYYLIQREKMKGIDKKALTEQIKKQIESGNFNLYKFIKDQFPG